MSKQTPGASMHRSGQTTTHEAPRAPHGHDNRTPHGIHESARSPSEAASSQPCIASPPDAPVQPDTQRLAATTSPQSHGQPPRTPHPASPWERRLAHGRSRARGAKTFPRGTRRPSENSGASAFRFCPLRCRFPAGAIRTTRRAKGAGPTRGGRQPWERASTRGRTRQSAHT